MINVDFKYVGFFKRGGAVSAPKVFSEVLLCLCDLDVGFLKCNIDLFHSVETLKESNCPFKLQNSTKGHTVILNLPFFKV